MLFAKVRVPLALSLVAHALAQPSGRQWRQQVDTFFTRRMGEGKTAAVQCNAIGKRLLTAVLAIA